MSLILLSGMLGIVVFWSLGRLIRIAARRFGAPSPVGSTIPSAKQAPRRLLIDIYTLSNQPTNHIRVSSSDSIRFEGVGAYIVAELREVLVGRAVGLCHAQLVARDIAVQWRSALEIVVLLYDGLDRGSDGRVVLHTNLGSRTHETTMMA